MRANTWILVVSMALSSVAGAAGTQTASLLPVDANCIVMNAGNSIATSLSQQMHSELTHDMHAVMGIFDMSCLSGIINFGGLRFFGLSSFLDGLQGRLCNAVRNWLTSTSGDPAHAALNQALAQITMGLPPVSPSEPAQKAQGVSQ